MTDDRAPNLPAREARLPRLTPSVFRDLAIWMVGLGLLIGLVFPPMVVVLGMPARQALTLRFFAACVVAGLLVGGVNFVLARLVVGRTLRRLSGTMRFVADKIRRATETGDWSDCEADGCLLDVDSADELGESAEAFNALITELERSREVEATIRDVSESLSRRLEVGPLAEDALERLLAHLGADDGSIVLTAGAEPRTLAGTPASDPASTFPVRFHDHELAELILPAAALGDAQARRLVELFVGAFGVALNNALAHEQSQDQARRDALTGLLAQRAFQASLEELVADGREFSLVVADIDDFKRVNDDHGHPAGDETLCRVAAALRLGTRPGDAAFRLGGDEFCLLLPRTDHATAVGVAERIRDGVPLSGAAIPVTVSVGVATSPHHGGSAEALIAQADAALYRSKREGKNRVTLAA